MAISSATKEMVELDASTSILFTKGCLGFQEVLDSFATAKRIFISTFNVLNKSGDLLDLLRNLPEDAHVTLVTKIPSWDDEDQYRKVLKAAQFKARVDIYFCPHNHSKIIATESIAYFGSANFTPRSADNFECGVIIRDADRIEEIINLFAKPLIKSSTRYHGGKSGAFHFEIRNYLRGCIGAIHVLRHYAAIASASEDDRQRMYDLALGTLRRGFGSYVKNMLWNLGDDRTVMWTDGYEAKAIEPVDEQVLSKAIALADAIHFDAIEEYEESLQPDPPSFEMAVEISPEIAAFSQALQQLADQLRQSITNLEASDEFKKENPPVS